MPEAVEKFKGRKIKGGSNPSVEVAWIITGTDDEAVAITTMLGTAPTTWGNAPIADYGAEQLADDIWEGNVVYSFTGPQKEDDEEGEETLSFDTTGGTQKVTQSLSTASFPRSGEDAPDFKGAIGVSKNGVEGVNAPAPALSFSKKRRFAAEFVDAAYIKTLSRLTGHYNDDEFFGFDAGEVRFDGARGVQKRVGEPWDIEFIFSCSENAEDLELGEITVDSKLGWQYLWVLHEEAEDTTAKFITPRALAAYVEDLPNCRPKDFSALGINTSA